MTYRSNRWPCGLRRAVSSLLAGVMMSSVALAQQTVGVARAVAPSTDDGTAPTAKPAGDANRASNAVTMEELTAIIKRLEGRVNELEAKLIRTSDAAPIATAVKAVREDVKSEAARKQEEKQNEGIMSFFRTTELSGFVDAYYGYNFNHPGVDTQLRNFDTKSSQFSLNLAKVVLEKKPISDSRLGFRTDLAFGPATEIVHASEPGGADVFKHIQQAYLSYLAPVGKGLQIDVGKFVTPNGAEVIETKDNWNYSRSLLFALAIPYYHFGVRATYAVNNKITVMGALVNGWNNVEDNNGGKTVGVSLTVKPTKKLTIIQNYTGGPEQDDSVPVPTGVKGKNFFRHLSDTVVTYNVNRKVFLMGNYDYAIERERTAGNKVHWQGLAAYLHFMPSEKWAFTPRFEWFQDHDGFATCTEDPLARCSSRKTFEEITLTGEYKFARNVLGRLEFRNDWADTPFFRKNTQLPLLNPVSVLSKRQATITAGLVFSFSTREQ